MREALLVSLVATTLGVGCASVGSALRTFDAASPGPGEGFVALAAESDDHIGSVEFCREGNLTSCFGTGAFTGAADVEVWRLPVGRYCAESITVTTQQTGASFTHTPRPLLCFDVLEGALVYPGHLRVQTESSQVLVGSIAIGWRVGEPGQVRAAYPLLESMELRVIQGTRRDR